MTVAGTWLVTGAAGQLGREVVRLLGSGLSGVPAAEVVGLSRTDLDVSDRGAVRAAVSALRPDVVVNCAAWTDVDACELDPRRAESVNATAVGHLREACGAVGAHLVQVSTDYVFDGTASTPYAEDHPTGPVNAYGASKLAGEAAAGQGATVVRTTWLQPADAPGMAGRVLEALASGVPIQVVSDRRACPTFVADLAPVLCRLGADRVAGVVHATNAGVTSWHGFARLVAEAAGHDPDTGLLVPVAEGDLPGERPARRPAYSALDNAVRRRLGHQPIRHHGDAVVDVVAGILRAGA